MYSENANTEKKMGKKQPTAINTDIIVSNRQFFQIPPEMLEYDYLNVVLNEKYDIDDEYVAIDKELW